METSQKLLSFQDSEGYRVSALLTEPQEEPRGVVVLCHGFLSSKQSNTNRRLTELLVPQQVSTFSFDWFGMGESGGSFSDISVGRCCDQLEQALAFIEQQGYQRVGLVGSSFGGYISILVAGQYPQLFALGLKCPVPDFPALLRMEFGDEGMRHWEKTGTIPNVTGGDKPIALRYDFYKDCLNHDAYRSAESINSPTLIVHGDRDELIPLDQVQRLVDSLTTRKQLRILKGANHAFGRPEDFRIMTTSLADWMTANLHQAPQHLD